MGILQVPNFIFSMSELYCLWRTYAERPKCEKWSISEKTLGFTGAVEDSNLRAPRCQAWLLTVWNVLQSFSAVLQGLQ